MGDRACLRPQGLWKPLVALPFFRDKEHQGGWGACLGGPSEVRAWSSHRCLSF